MKNLSFSLKTAIMMPLIIVFSLIMLTIILAKTFAYENMVQDVSKKQLTILTQNIKANLDNFLQSTFKISETMAHEIEYRLEYENIKLEQLSDYLIYAYQDIENHIPHFKSIVVGFADTGELIGIKRISDNKFYYLEAKNGLLTMYNGDRNSEIRNVIPNFDPRSRPWFTPVAKTKKPTWSKLYNNADSFKELTMSALSPILKNNELIGVFSTDISLAMFNKFLAAQLNNNNSSIFIFDDQGLSIAHSYTKGKKTKTEEQKIQESEENIIKERKSILNTGNSLVTIAAKTAMNLSLNTLNVDSVYSFEYQGERYFAMLSPYKDNYGLDWNVAITLPESEFVGNLPALKHSALVGVIFYCIGIAIIGFIAFNKITLRIKSATDACSNFAKGEWNTRAPEGSKINELHDLGVSFNYMADQLQNSFDRLNYQLKYDSLTHVLNRKGLIDDYNKIKNKKGILITFSIERFLEITDSLGLDKTDKALLKVTKRIKNITPRDGLISRIADNIFALYLPNFYTESCAKPFIYHLQQQFQLPLQVEGEFIFINYAIGSALTGNDELMKNTVRNALLALTSAKKDPSGYATYHPQMAKISEQRSQMVFKITQALDNNEFIPFYQPLIDLKTNKVIGAEALARWVTPENKIISPNLFIPLAEEYGLIHRVGFQILYKACLDAQLSIESGRWDKDFHLHVNVSVKQLLVSNFKQTLNQVLNETNISTNNLMLEITESNFMTNNVIVRENVEFIKSLGIGIAIDDFGTGYSSLSALKNIDFNCLKIDRSFINNITLDNQEDVIVSAILSMTRDFDASVVSEGIETKEQAAILKKLGCHQGQGFLYSKPIPIEDWPYDPIGQLAS